MANGIEGGFGKLQVEKPDTGVQKEKYYSFEEQEEKLRKINNKIKDLNERISNGETEIVYINGIPYELLGSREEIDSTIKALNNNEKCAITGNAEVLTIDGKYFGRPIDQLGKEKEYFDEEYANKVLEVNLPEKNDSNIFSI